jgi:predicted permease
MANPNIVNVTSIYGNTSYLIPSTTAATTWTALTPATNTVNKIDNIVAANVTASIATVTVSINSAAAGAGTAYRLIYQVPIPVNASIVIVDKSTAFYLGEAQSVVVTVGTASAIELTASYEAIT